MSRSLVFTLAMVASLTIRTNALVVGRALPHRRPMVELAATTQAAEQQASVKLGYIQSGAAMELKDVCISIGNNDILNNLNWAILPGERWGLVGKNGEGKSTLLKALTNSGENISVRKGDVLLSNKYRLGYLEQKGVSGSTMTVRQEVTSRMERLAAATKALEHAEKLVGDGDTSEEALKLLEDASMEFEEAGGYTVEQKISNVLKGLGFLTDDYDRLCSEFSGGWQMRIALARLLLSDPDLLILDEPTNHLDKGARDWLGSYLGKYEGTLLLVSHDENLLKTAVNSIAEVQSGDVQLFKSRTHDQWLVEREERVKAIAAAYEASQREIARMQEFVDRFGAKTMGASLAQSRMKTIEKLEAAAPVAPRTQADTGPVARLRLPTPPRGSQILLSLQNANIAWENNRILNDVNVVIERGWRVAVRGPNGAGKSTLFSALAGELPLESGDRLLGDGLELGIFKQDLAQELDPTMTGVEVVTNHVRSRDPSISDEKARTVLGTLGLIREKGVRLVGHLSGGEKARVALACFVLIPHNLLLLDEPSNHLDVQTIKALSEGIQEFTGSTIVISHDRSFLEEFNPTHILTVRDGKVTLEERGLRDDDWKDALNSRENTNKFADNPSASSSTNKNIINSANKKKSKSEPAIDVEKSSAPVAAALRAEPADAPKKKVNNQRIGKIETMISKYEKEMGAIDVDMQANGRNRDKLYDLQKEKDELQKKVDKLYEELSSL